METAAADTVTVELAQPDPGVMAPGENVQFRLLGTPLQESEIGLFSDPDCIFATTVKLADFPGAITRDDGVALKLTLDVAAGAQVEL